jgi:4-alpha-glucanotransferase
LPSPFGIGDLGPSAFAWIDTLAGARQKWWQILPLGPTGYGDSPYQCFGALAGNPYLISPELLIKDGLVHAQDFAGLSFPDSHVDFGPVINFKVRMLARAWENFQGGSATGLKIQFEEFRARQAGWLADFALFMALKDAHGGKSWLEWPARYLRREPAALAEARRDLASGIGQQEFRQFLFFRQWQDVKRHAREKGIGIIGDIPIFVSSDCADVWANPGLFCLDEHGRPSVVAGVPPDYFSATGQLWGNPLYRWEAMEKDGFAWWVGRLRAMLELVDIIRVDHFRGFEAYWEVPAGKPTAEIGQWVKAPGDRVFATLKSALGGLPVIAEDLGVITPEVEALRDHFGLPGMRILQFAFDSGPTNKYLPFHYVPNTIVYTGTHDNDTTHGWFSTRSPEEAAQVRRYLARDGNDIAWDLIRLAWSSVANGALAPLQDILDLGTEARMNLPGRAAGNWGWRFTPQMLKPEILDRLADITEVYGR